MQNFFYYIVEPVNPSIGFFCHAAIGTGGFLPVPESERSAFARRIRGVQAGKANATRAFSAGLMVRKAGFRKAVLARFLLTCYTERAMKEKAFRTSCGIIRYWVSTESEATAPQLVFLPRLTADHRLFGKQLAHFEGRYPVLVWDAPGHGASRPFELTFAPQDKADWLEEILRREGFASPVIVGQSMGGYVGQMYAQRFPHRILGFVSIDSAPLARSYMTAAEIWLLKRMEPVYRFYPWKLLVRTGTNGVAVSPDGRRLMRDMMATYDGDHAYYAKLAGHGYRMLAGAVEAGLPYEIPCPALLICGEKDRAGSCIRYNKAWHRKTGIPIAWIPGAGHNSNTDDPDTVNRLIGDFVRTCAAERAGNA